MAGTTGAGKSASGAAPGGHNPWLIAGVVALATFMEVLDTTIANVALRYISGGLAVGPDEAAWVVTSYLVANAITLTASSFLAKRYGRKAFFTWSVGLFTIASILCGFAWSLESLLFFRVLQGLGGGGMAPLAQSILADSFPPAKRGQAFALYGVAIVVAPVIGPTLGGWLSDNASWHWCFLINGPIGVIALGGLDLFVDFFLDEHHGDHGDVVIFAQRQRRDLDIGWQLQLRQMDDVAFLQLSQIELDELRQILRQAGDFDFRQVVRNDQTGGLGGRRGFLVEEVQRHVDANDFVLFDAQEIHVHHQLLEGVLLPVTHQHLLHLAVDVEVEHRRKEPLVLGSEQDGVVFDLDAFRILARAVNDGRHEARMTQAAARTFPLVFAALRLDFVCLSHVGIALVG